MSWWQIYLLTRLDILKDTAVLCWIIGGVVFIFLTIMLLIANDDAYFIKHHRDDYIKLRNKIILPVFLFGLFINILLPTQKEFAAMYLIPKVTNSAVVDKTTKALDKGEEVLFDKLNQWLDSFKEKK